MILKCKIDIFFLFFDENFIFRQTQGKEIAALRTQIIGLETDNKRLKSLLTNERYER
jgi:hypothetical protein